jgi:hypothetical protein
MAPAIASYQLRATSDQRPATSCQLLHGFALDPAADEEKDSRAQKHVHDSETYRRDECEPDPDHETDNPTNHPEHRFSLGLHSHAGSWSLVAGSW